MLSKLLKLFCKKLLRSLKKMLKLKWLKKKCKWKKLQVLHQLQLLLWRKMMNLTKGIETNARKTTRNKLVPRTITSRCIELKSLSKK